MSVRCRTVAARRMHCASTRRDHSCASVVWWCGCAVPSVTSMAEPGFTQNGDGTGANGCADIGLCAQVAGQAPSHGSQMNVRTTMATALRCWLCATTRLAATRARALRVRLALCVGASPCDCDTQATLATEKGRRAAWMSTSAPAPRPVKWTTAPATPRAPTRLVCGWERGSCDVMVGAGSYFCTCNMGYSGNGTVCDEINECTSPNLCSPYSATGCVNVCAASCSTIVIDTACRFLGRTTAAVRVRRCVT